MTAPRKGSTFRTGAAVIWVLAGGLCAVQPPAPSRGSQAAAPQPAPAKHWAFAPPKLPRVPKVRRAAWVRNPIDTFVLARLEEKGLTPSPEADPRALIRRVTLDLTGLLPTPDEVEAFVRESSSSSSSVSSSIRARVRGRGRGERRTPNADPAYDRLVDRLLASPQYGERWAQHWLDVVRFGETNGFELDADRPQAWRYRDWVVRALNEDRPYDRFLQEQIAGDEIAPGDFDARVATGFLRAGPQHVVAGNQDEALNRQEWLTEAVTGVGAAVLGLTIQCARCHDHKFDPIPQKDYYRLQAFFAATASEEYPRGAPGDQQAYEKATREHRTRLQPLKDQIAAIEKPYRDRLRVEKAAKLTAEYRDALAMPADRRTKEQRQLASEAQVMLKVDWDELVAALGPEDRDRRAALRRQMHALDLQAPEPPPIAPGVGEKLSPVPTVHLLRRGDPHAPGEAVEPGFPAVLGPSPVLGKSIDTRRRRADLARWITRPDHPLTARVIVNRLWQHHFGRGLVATPNDFGRHGQPPTHPELLDWLALHFVRGIQVSRYSGIQDPNRRSPIPEYLNARIPGYPPGTPWSLKRLHYLMVTSSTYRQASAPNAQRPTPNAQRLDPDNRLLGRMTRRRLDGEALRDAVLGAAGTLNLQRGGPPVRVPLEPEVYDTIFTEGEPDNLWSVTPDPRQHARRSLYLLRKRNVRLPMLAVFDQPDMMSPCAARGQSVHALQSLTLMNSDFMLAQSRELARRLLREPAGGDRTRIDRLYTLTLGRPARPPEATATERFLHGQTVLLRGRLERGEPVARLADLPAGVDPAAAAAWADLCLAMFNLNEFVYVR